MLGTAFAHAAEKTTAGDTCSGDQNSFDWDTGWDCVSGAYQRAPLFVGASTATCDTDHEGQIRYNSTSKVIEVCNGSSWTAQVQVQSTAPPTAPSGSGYFVLTSTTYDGNLGGVTGADAKCLTELTTNTTWLGYSTANSNGQLVAGKVHAFLCYGDNSGSCQQELSPLTTYYFAVVGSASIGGASFTTDSNGVGPNDSADWAAANRFGGSYTYWIGNRTNGDTSTTWGTASAAFGASTITCGGWIYNSSYTGTAGISANTDAARWASSTVACSNSLPLVCFVNP